MATEMVRDAAARGASELEELTQQLQSTVTNLGTGDASKQKLEAACNTLGSIADKLYNVGRELQNVSKATHRPGQSS